MFKKIVFLLIIFQINCAFSQKETINFKDSIAKYIYNNPNKAIQISHSFLKTIENSDRIDDKVLSYSILGIAYEIKNDIDSTLYYYQKCLNLVTKPNDLIQYKYSIGVIYENEFNYKDALQLYDQALKIAKQEKNEYFIYEVKAAIASIKNKIGQSEEARVLIQEVYDRNKKNKSSNLKFNRKTLIETYLNSNMVAEADLLIEEGLNQALKTNNYEFQYYLYKLKSENEILKNELNEAELSAEKAIKNAQSLSNNEFIDEANYTLVVASSKKGDYKKTITILNEIINNKREKTLRQNSKYFKLLANAYKKAGEESLSNEFYQKYILEEEKVNKKRLSTLERIHSITLKNQVSDIEDTHELELSEEILEKQKQVQTKKAWTAISISLLVLMVSLFLFFRSKSNKEQKRFDDLLVKINRFEQQKVEENKSKTENKVAEEESIQPTQEIEPVIIKEISDNELDQEIEATYVIDNNKVQEILTKLQALEDKMYFLRQDCTMHNMAKRLKTNTSYLSKIINTHLDKSFSTYINELRINHAILELKNNKRLRAYSVKGIAEEMGYKNADAFSRYFKSATGISPSVYIKKIEEI